MNRANPDRIPPPSLGLDAPTFVLRMNWWRLSDAARLKWLRELRRAIMEEALPRLNAEIRRREGECR